MSQRVIEFRKHLSLNDLHYITNTLAGDSLSESNALFQLLTDPNTVDSILDQPKLFETILNQPTTISISPRLYFYILTRHNLKRDGLDSAELADYISGVLESFLKSGRDPNSLGSIFYLIDWAKKVEVTSQGERYELYIAAGNHLLFLTGIFPQFIHRRTVRKGAPGLHFYETVAKNSFYAASEHPYSRAAQTDSLYATLAEEFTDLRAILNDLADRLITLH